MKWKEEIAMFGLVRTTGILAGVLTAILPLAVVVADGGNSGSNPDGAGYDKPVADGGGSQGPAYFDGNNGCGQDRKQDVAPDEQGGYDDNNGNCGPGRSAESAQVDVAVKGQFGFAAGAAGSNPDSAGLDKPAAESQGPAYFDSNNGCGQDRKLDVVPDHQGGFDDNNGNCGPAQAALAAQLKANAKAQLELRAAVAAEAKTSEQAQLAAQQQAAVEQQATVAGAGQSPASASQSAAAVKGEVAVPGALPSSGGPPGEDGTPWLPLAAALALVLGAGASILRGSFPAKD
jgi:hypothetical protein